MTTQRNVPSTSEAIELVELLHEVNRGIRARVKDALGGDGVPPGQLRLLQLIGRSPEPLRLVDIAEVLGIAQRSVTTKVEDAIAAGLVSKQPDPSDRRATRVELTDRGRGMVARASEARALQADALLAELAPADRRELIRLLGEVAKGTRS